ncbi:MAG TPA: tetratricopeptide repeat protein [Thermoanaerobaculia bacterium]|nr:tetratricopeptide repeat protein [Thermoanaerobaculia bacterium]
MSDGFPDRLTQLRARWQGDPTSRIFLQLAEEYRHLGRVKDALEVLETGLEEHPGYLSALVAKGRCHLELGEAESARAVLERVVQQDATQMVANKLLVRAYLETGEPERARQRLDLYSLLNDSDPEIEELRRRVVEMNRRPRAADSPRSAESAERPRMDPTLPPLEGLRPAKPLAGARQGAPPPAEPSAAPAPAAPPADLFDLGPPVASSPAGNELFELAELPAAPLPPPVAATAEASVLAADLSAMEAPALELPAGPAENAEDAEDISDAAWVARGNGDLFPDPAPEESRRRYLAGLLAEGIFWFGAAEELASAAAVEIAEPLEHSEGLKRPATAALIPPAEPAAPLPAVPLAPPFPAAYPSPPFPAHDLDLDTLAEPVRPWQLLGGEGETAERAPREGERTLPGGAPFAEPSDAWEAASTAPEEEVRPPAATATLGNLYLRQGHREEAERIFRQVLTREPGNLAAREALERIGAQHEPPPPLSPLTAAQLLAGYQPGAAGEAATATATRKARKVFLLQSYLARLRQPWSRNVS